MQTNFWAFIKKLQIVLKLIIFFLLSGNIMRRTRYVIQIKQCISKIKVSENDVKASCIYKCIQKNSICHYIWVAYYIFFRQLSKLSCYSNDVHFTCVRPMYDAYLHLVVFSWFIINTWFFLSVKFWLYIYVTFHFQELEGHWQSKAADTVIRCSGTKTVIDLIAWSSDYDDDNL